jgi:hypothetical protein
MKRAQETPPSTAACACPAAAVTRGTSTMRRRMPVQRAEIHRFSCPRNVCVAAPGDARLRYA